ncbi:MAG: hypothetical protein KIT09_34680 [Bryobacteraceae bacterium]|nr:hypothetical protein [Bryobacteraceae bacterium]
MRLGFCVLIRSLLFATGAVAGDCDLSLRDQVLLIQISEVAPDAGTMEVTSMRGAEVDCAAIGRFHVVRYRGSGMYVLDPGCAFNRWGRTGVSFVGGPLAALKSYFYVHERSNEKRGLWYVCGRGQFTEQEKAWMLIDENQEFGWVKTRLVDNDVYRSAVSESASWQEADLIRGLIREKVHAYLAFNEPAVSQVVGIDIGPIRRYLPDASVTATYRGKDGQEKKLLLRVPINPEAIPYVGYPIEIESRP